MPQAVQQALLIALLVRFDLPMPSTAVAVLLGISHNAAKKTARVLRKKRAIEIHPMPTGGVFYSLSNRYRRKAGLPVRRRTACVQHLLIQAVGLIGGCIRADLHRLTPAEVAEDYPGCADNERGARRYAQDGDGRLHLVLVAHTGNARSLARKVKHEVTRRSKIPAFDARMSAGHFRVTVAVPSDGVRVDLLDQLQQTGLDPDVTVTPVVVPELVPLLLGELRD